MNKLWAVVIAVLAAVSLTTVVAFTVVANDDRGARSFRARLTGYEETPVTLSSPGSGILRLRIGSDGQSATYTLTYSGLIGVTAAHIHLGARGTTGGVIIFLCDTAENAIPNCPPSAGTVSGTLTPAGVIGPTSQGIAPGEWDEFVAALRAGFTYANVHTAAFPGGEIRGQLRAPDDD